MQQTFPVSTIEEALEDYKQGKFLVVVDDEDRENEGDLIMAAECCTPEAVNFMLKNGRGVLCAPITLERCKQLDLDFQVQRNTSMLGTPFTVTVDKLEGCTTGVSCADRCATIKALADPNSKPEDFGRPGHINPLYAQDRGVLARAGHTEAAVDLSRLCGFQPAACLIEILNEDGTMARMPQLQEFAKREGLKIITIKDLIAYRLRQECLVERAKKWICPQPMVTSASSPSAKKTTVWNTSHSSRASGNPAKKFSYASTLHVPQAISSAVHAAIAANSSTAP